MSSGFTVTQWSEAERAISPRRLSGGSAPEGERLRRLRTVVEPVSDRHGPGPEGQVLRRNLFGVSVGTLRVW